MELTTPRIAEQARAVTAATFDSFTNAIVVVPTLAQVKELPYGTKLAEQARRYANKARSRQPIVTDLPNKTATRVSINAVAGGSSTFELLTLARALVAAHRDHAPERLLVVAQGLEPALARRALDAVVAAVLAANAPLPHYGQGAQSRAPRLRELQLHGARSADGYAITVAASKGNQLARHLTLLPANVLTPRAYRKYIQPLARRYRWRSEFLDSRRLRGHRAGAFLAVMQASPARDAGILRLVYAPRKAAAARVPALVLIGKGVCYDTGGINVKTAQQMYGMHGDMQGSAVALGTLLGLTELKVDFGVECWLALAQNQIGPDAYKPGDVVTAASGTTIEVVHTDAEGRMLLADTLALASRRKPLLIIDYATLTGACVRALSHRYSGVMTNRPDLIPVLVQAGAASGERVWPFPIDADYEEDLRSDIADIKRTSNSVHSPATLITFSQRCFCVGSSMKVRSGSILTSRHVVTKAGLHTSRRRLPALVCAIHSICCSRSKFCKRHGRAPRTETCSSCLLAITDNLP